MNVTQSDALPRRHGDVNVDTFLLWLVVLMPPAGLMLAHASSMGSGLLGASLAILGIEFLTARGLRTGLSWRAGRLRSAVVIVTGVLLHALLLSLAWHQVNWSRVLGSLCVLLVVLLASACMRDRLLRHSSAEVTQILRRTAWMLCFLAVLSQVAPPIFPPINHPRPVVVFSEPSHFALAFIPFVAFFIVQSRNRSRWLIVVGSVALALWMQSTTLLAGLIMILVTCLKWRQLVGLLAIGALAALGLGFDDSYIVDRLVFSEEIHNVSNLVLLQGWERAWLALVETHGLGLGFQQFGVWGPMGDLQDLILAVAGDNLNLEDGGTTASKLVGEFGAFGIALLGLWFYWWWRASHFLGRAVRGARQPAAAVFMHVCVVAIGVELWVRGVGYLSLGLFLLGLVVAGRPVLVLPALRTAGTGESPEKAARGQVSIS